MASGVDFYLLPTQSMFLIFTFIPNSGIFGRNGEVVERRESRGVAALEAFAHVHCEVGDFNSPFVHPSGLKFCVQVNLIDVLAVNIVKTDRGQSYKHFTIVNYDSRVVPDLQLPHIMTLES